MVYRDLGDLAAAEAELIEVVALDEAVGHPNLESDRAALRQVQAQRAAAPGKYRTTPLALRISKSIVRYVQSWLRFGG